MGVDSRCCFNSAVPAGYLLDEDAKHLDGCSGDTFDRVMDYAAWQNKIACDWRSSLRWSDRRSGSRSSLVAFKREYGEAETLESTRMRGAFAYVSYQMFLDKPITGFGFNQFQIYNRPYLDDRTTNIRLESIRGYVHHNSFASILVDLGLVGGILYFGLVVACFRSGRRLYLNRAAPDWAHATVIVAAAVSVCHAIQMAFHEVSFSTIENTVLAMSLGMMCAASQDFATAQSLGTRWIRWRTLQDQLGLNEQLDERNQNAKVAFFEVTAFADV